MTAFRRGLSLHLLPRGAGTFLGPVLTFLSWLIAVFLVAVSGPALGEYVGCRTLTRIG
ncbi:hypothetical protein [Streptomyces canus]|uniref:hypothetical protein n=1 Tax=Streptomyces canus TaxID=58343 RepID=UPI0036F1476D